MLAAPGRDLPVNGLATNSCAWSPRTFLEDGMGLGIGAAASLAMRTTDR